ncbi:MAG TPA: hypothetical protein VJ144_07665, partial [Candidatus Polarisedimenticolia bacterium]|nr:hypothetical protein [Candidatus Polarisedimenticolia bacterium]
FRILQIPMNLFEPGGALVRNTGPGDGQTALEAAAAGGLDVLINRPLNAFAGGRLIRLADPLSASHGVPVVDVQTTLQALEKEYRSGIAREQAGPGVAAADRFFELVEQVAGISDQIVDAQHWQQVEQQYVIPRINMMVGELAHRMPPGLHGRWEAWWQRYLPALQGLLRETGRTAALKGREQAAAIAAAIDPGLPAERRTEPLACKSIWVVSSTPAVGCVLVGMRRPAYVEEVLPVMGWPVLPDPLAVYRRMSAAAGAALHEP